MKVADNISRGTLECEWVNPFMPRKSDSLDNISLTIETWEKYFKENVNQILTNNTSSKIYKIKNYSYIIFKNVLIHFIISLKSSKLVRII